MHANRRAGAAPVVAAATGGDTALAGGALHSTLLFLPNRPMTYCVAIKLNAGLVFLSDSRTNAGLTRSAPSAR